MSAKYIPAHSAFTLAILTAAAQEPCVGHPGSRKIAERLVREEPGKYGLTPEQVPPAPVAPVPTPKLPQDKPKGQGTCAQVRAWVVANPTATKEQAIAHFPNVNKSTVQVQFGHARRDGK